MAPVPEDNQDNTPSNASGDDSEHFSNPNLSTPVVDSDFSDTDESEDNNGVPNGYSLLPQEPDDENYANSDDESMYNAHSNGDSFNDVPQRFSDIGSEIEGVDPDVHTQSILSSNEATAPTVSVSNESHHPAFLARFPDGKIPAYMQVPKIPQDKNEHLWNQQLQESSKLSLDPVQESKILKAMSAFSLPSENIPEWARGLPDDQWYQHLSRVGIISGKGKQPLNTKHLTSSNSESKEETNNLATDGEWVADFGNSALSHPENK